MDAGMRFVPRDVHVAQRAIVAVAQEISAAGCNVIDAGA